VWQCGGRAEDVLAELFELQERRSNDSANNGLMPDSAWSWVWPVLLGIAGGLLLFWLALLLTLWVTKPDEVRLREARRLLPDLLRLLRRLAGDRTLSRSVRVRLGLLLIYLASPIDLVPDFIPVLGYADDAIVVALTLRSVARAAGPEALERHWTGSPEGLVALRHLAKI
jgi:uncharacterized membrane protein YkvA (DUF1232 family)